MERMNRRPILSIIVPVYNVEPYLERCLLSCLHQDIPHDDYEIIVVNDGSTDGSLQVAERIAKENDNILLLNKKNGGASSARNHGLQKASGKYIMFVDADDYLFENVLNDLVSQCEQYHLDVLCFWTCFENGSKKWDTEHQPFNDSDVMTGEYTLMHGMRIDSVWQFVFNRELLLEQDLRFTEGIACSEDVLFIMKLFPYVKRVMFTHHKVYVYSIDHPSVMRTDDTERKFKLVMDQLHVINEVKQFEKEKGLKSSIRIYYDRRMNSLEVSHFLMFINQKYPWSYICGYMNEARRLGLYPIKGRTLSFKTTLLIPVINSYFYRWILRLNSTNNSICNGK